MWHWQLGIHATASNSDSWHAATVAPLLQHTCSRDQHVTTLGPNTCVQAVLGPSQSDWLAAGTTRARPATAATQAAGTIAMEGHCHLVVKPENHLSMAAMTTTVMAKQPCSTVPMPLECARLQSFVMVPAGTMTFHWKFQAGTCFLGGTVTVVCIYAYGNTMYGARSMHTICHMHTCICGSTTCGLWFNWVHPKSSTLSQGIMEVSGRPALLLCMSTYLTSGGIAVFSLSYNDSSMHPLQLEMATFLAVMMINACIAILQQQKQLKACIQECNFFGCCCTNPARPCLPAGPGGMSVGQTGLADTSCSY